MPSRARPTARSSRRWTTLAAWAALTERIELGLLVGANTFRNPGLTAKARPDRRPHQRRTCLARPRRRLERSRARRLRARLRPRLRRAPGPPRRGPGRHHRALPWRVGGLAARWRLPRSMTSWRGRCRCAGRVACRSWSAAAARRRPCARPPATRMRGTASATSSGSSASSASSRGTAPTVGRDIAEIAFSCGPFVIIRDDPADALRVLNEALAPYDSAGAGQRGHLARPARAHRRALAQLRRDRGHLRHRRPAGALRSRDDRANDRGTGTRRRLMTAALSWSSQAATAAPSSAMAWPCWPRRRGRTSARRPRTRPLDHRQHRRRPRAPRAARLPRPRHRPVHASRPGQRGHGLGRAGRDLVGARDARAVRAADLVRASATATSPPSSCARSACAAAPG